MWGNVNFGSPSAAALESRSQFAARVFDRVSEIATAGSVG
jgi:hypothetical protein